MNVKCNKNIERKTLINVETKVNVAEKSPYYNRNEIEYVSSDEGSDAEAIPIYAVVGKQFHKDCLLYNILIFDYFVYSRTNA